MNERRKGASGSAEDDWYASYSYGSLLMQQPHVPFQGLWRGADRFYVLCPEPVSGLTTLDGAPLQQWFENSCRILCAPVELVHILPVGAVPVPDQTLGELAQLSGFPFTVPELVTRLAVVLPREIPMYSVRHEPPNLIFEVPRPLTPDEVTALRGAVGAMRVPLQPVVEIHPGGTTTPRGRHASAEHLTPLLPARFLPSTLSRPLRRLAEEDEDVWLGICKKVLGGGAVERETVLPKLACLPVSRCVVDSTVGQAENLRIYLTAFRQVALALPLVERSELALHGLRVTEADLIALAERRRLLVVLPHSLERYDAGFLSRLAEHAPDSLLLSRRLAAATILEVRRRVPLFFPPLTLSDRATLARALLELEDDPQLGALAQVLREELTRIWRDAPFAVNFRGAVAVPWFGLGPVLAGLHRTRTGDDVTLETVSAARSVEWSAALRGVSIPLAQDVLQELCASAYSGVRPIPGKPVGFSDLETVVNGLLALDNDIPVLELVDALAGNDSAVLNRVITGMLTSRDTPETVKKEVVAFNREVRRFERNVKKFQFLDLLALAGAVYPLVGSGSASQFVPLAVWLAGKAVAASPRIPGPVGKTLTWLQAKATSVPSEAIVVARLRRKL